MTTKYTQQDIADALTVFITSGSASGNEAMRRYCLSRVKSFAEADRLRADNAALVAALEALIDGRPTEEPPAIAKIAHRNWQLFGQARAALAKYKEGK